jgi:NADH:ubiquinone oxidoreductase subunit 3 (subunit A)
MKLIALFFVAGLLLGIVLSVIRLRKTKSYQPKSYKKIEKYECGVCDERNCDCHKKDE